MNTAHTGTLIAESQKKGKRIITFIQWWLGFFFFFFCFFCPLISGDICERNGENDIVLLMTETIQNAIKVFFFFLSFPSPCCLDGVNESLFLFLSSCRRAVHSVENQQSAMFPSSYYSRPDKLRLSKLQTPSATVFYPTQRPQTSHSHDRKRVCI